MSLADRFTVSKKESAVPVFGCAAVLMLLPIILFGSAWVVTVSVQAIVNDGVSFWPILGLLTVAYSLTGRWKVGTRD